MNWKRVIEWRRARAASWHDYDLVFPSRNGKPIDRGTLDMGRFKSLLRRAKLAEHFTLYSLRYTYATLQMLAGERDKVISDQMEHTRVNFTKDVYTRVLPVMSETASDRLEKLLFQSVGTTLAQSVTDQVM